MKLAIADRRVALVPLRIDATQKVAMLEGVIVVHASPLLEALAQLFEFVWERATPLFPTQRGSTEHLDATDHEILMLLAAGAKDESIAHTLGLADRTIGRRIGVMMSRLNVRTRFQLGQQAIKMEWMT